MRKTSLQILATCHSVCIQQVADITRSLLRSNCVRRRNVVRSLTAISPRSRCAASGTAPPSATLPTISQSSASRCPSLNNAIGTAGSSTLIARRLACRATGPAGISKNPLISYHRRARNGGAALASALGGFMCSEKPRSVRRQMQRVSSHGTTGGIDVDRAQVATTCCGY